MNIPGLFCFMSDLDIHKKAGERSQKFGIALQLVS